RPPAALRLPPTRRYLVVTAAGRAGTGRYLQDQRGWAVAGEALHCEGFTSGGRGAGTARPPLRGRTHWAAPAHPAVSEPGPGPASARTKAPAPRPPASNSGLSSFPG